jgi:murein DD-endopeptidase MepM/ murein hydrolase activator NlpD
MSDYYDEKGKTLRSFFLKAPVNYSRISSRFTKRRFHPVQKRWKAHKGTDYAAGYGTPIVATANGTVTKSGYTGGNGNYVKIKHSGTYSTQYLHMTKRKVKVGQRVKQGQIIGTVGSTGLATGPHVCYRFWVNGKQVDPYKQNLPSAEPLPKTKMKGYLQFVAPLKVEIDQLPFKESDPII